MEGNNERKPDHGPATTVISPPIPVKAYSTHERRSEPAPSEHRRNSPGMDGERQQDINKTGKNQDTNNIS